MDIQQWVIGVEGIHKPEKLYATFGYVCIYTLFSLASQRDHDPKTFNNYDYEDISLNYLCVALLWDHMADDESTSLTSFRAHHNLYNFHFTNFLCLGKELIQIKPLYCMYLQTGFFHLPHGDFFIEPVKNHLLAEGVYHPHVMYRRQRPGVPEMKEPTCGLKGTVT